MTILIARARLTWCQDISRVMLLMLMAKLSVFVTHPRTITHVAAIFSVNVPLLQILTVQKMIYIPQCCLCLHRSKLHNPIEPNGILIIQRKMQHEIKLFIYGNMFCSFPKALKQD